MPGVAYISTAADKERYGIPLAENVEIYRASSLIDHYLRRPKGCVWLGDSIGRPLYMKGANPSISYSTTALISPGSVVEVPVPNYVSLDDSIIGDVLILDRFIPNIAEAVIVKSARTGYLTFTSVLNTHDGISIPITMDRGLLIEEERGIPGGRAVAKLSEWPVVAVLSAVGRYGYPRRSEQMLGYYAEQSLLLNVAAGVGGPPTWNTFSIANTSLNQATGDIWIPAGIYGAYYTDIKARYIGGWQQENVPEDIKIAAATLVTSLGAAPMGAMIRRFNTGKVQIERFADTVIDNDTKSLLRPYMANWMT